jgi:hypothetical protein
VETVKEKIILADDPRSAEYRTNIEGWVSRHGKFYGTDEFLARWDGSTHKACDKCGALYAKNSYCRPCSEKRKDDKFAAMPEIEWDGKAMLYSQLHDEYFSDMDAANEYADEHEIDPAEMQLIICAPNYVPTLESDFCDGYLPDDNDDLPQAVADAMDDFNKAVHGIVLSWSPGKFRLKVTG